MKNTTLKFKAKLYIIIGFAITAFIVVILFISPIAKYLGTKYGEMKAAEALDRDNFAIS